MAYEEITTLLVGRAASKVVNARAEPRLRREEFVRPDQVQCVRIPARRQINDPPDVPRLRVGGHASRSRTWSAKHASCRATCRSRTRAEHFHSITADFGQVDHAFRPKAITGFGRRRSRVSLQVDHAFRSMAITVRERATGSG